ncbi:MAG: isopenicillin N synthase family oxygenase [Sandaracinaceae bacterium]|nr:isopenicillin N synthase family oxygenase [Myxococcales bacterium]MCB9657876.1 isopenicillin N synthase family oxygenase [Sandaracinaceae bacterium]
MSVGTRGPTALPVLDLADAHSPDPAARVRAEDAVRAGLGHFGLVYIRSHGLDADELSGFYDDFLALCARPEAEKQTWASGDIWYQRGWTPPNTEKAVIAGGQPDFKECYFIAPEPLDDELRDVYPEIYADNRWPEDAPDFERRYSSLGRAIHAVGMQVLSVAATSLGLPADTFAERTGGGPHVTRALRYLPLSAEQAADASIVWGEEHTDFNLLTLLPGGRFFDPSGAPCARPDSTSGLYLRTRPTEEHPKGELVHGAPPPGCIVAQVGQQLEILTGGAFLATPHVITAPSTPGYSRTSMAHFIHVHSLQPLFPLPAFCTPEARRSYGPPVLAGTYSLKTLVDIGLAPREALDKLGYRHYGRLDAVRHG